jgi:hypothetical protein
MLVPYTPPVAGAGSLDYMPFLSIRLEHRQRSVDSVGLVDSGAMVNVMPYDLGIQLGLDWNAPAPQIRLTGNLGRVPAKAIVVRAIIGNYPPVGLTFAWSQSPDARLLLGQFNFFFEFEVCFFRWRAEFEVRPRP